MTFFVGIDVAKFKHDCFIADDNGRVIKDSFSFKNDKDGFNILLLALNELKPIEQIKIGFESTGHYHFNLKLFLEENNFTYMEFNPLLVHKFISTFSLRRTKTDKKDASMIARYLMTVDYKPYPIKFYHINNLKSLCRFKESLIIERTKYLNKLTVILDLIFPEFKPFFENKFSKTAFYLLSMYRNPKRISNLSIDAYNKMRSKLKHTISYQKFCVLKNLAANSIGNTDEVLNLELDSLLALHLFLNAQIEAMEKKIIEIYQSLAYKVHSIRGVGLDSAAIIASEIGNFSRFASAHQLLAFAGLDPSQSQSGISESSGKMVKHGSSYLRAAIMRVAETFYVHNPLISDFYWKKRKEGKAHNVALSHVARKLINTIFALEKSSNKVFNPALLK